MVRQQFRRQSEQPDSEVQLHWRLLRYHIDQ